MPITKKLFVRAPRRATAWGPVARIRSGPAISLGGRTAQGGTGAMVEGARLERRAVRPSYGLNPDGAFLLRSRSVA